VENRAVGDQPTPRLEQVRGAVDGADEREVGPMEPLLRAGHCPVDDLTLTSSRPETPSAAVWLARPFMRHPNVRSHFVRDSGKSPALSIRSTVISP